MKKLIALAAFALTFAGALWAETELTVETAVASALRNNISIQRSRLALGTLERTSDHSWNGLFPSVSLEAGGTKYDSDDFYSTFGSVNASVSLSPSFLQSIKVSRLKYEAGKISYRTAMKDVELAVRKAFFEILYQRENVAVLADSVETARKQYEQTLSKRKIGQASELDTLSAQVTLENLKPDLSSAEVTYQSDLASFKQTVGIDQGETIVLVGDLDDVQEMGAIDISRISALSPTTESLANSLDAAKAAKAFALSGTLLPVFTLSYSYKKTFNAADTGNTVGTGLASASVSLPLDGFFPWTDSNDAIDSAADEVRDVELRLMEDKTSTAIDIQSFQNRIEKSLVSVKARKLGVALAGKTAEMTADAYAKGTKDLMALLDANDSLKKARVLLMQEEYTLAATVLDLEYTLGVPFGTLGR